MNENIRISPEERASFVRERSPDYPKYTSQILNLANQNAKSTRRSLVGPMKNIVEEFTDKYPNGTYEDWEQYYLNEYDGEERLEESTEELLQMVSQMEEAMEKIDDDLAHMFIRDLVLYKTYQGTSRDIKEVVLKKLSQIYDLEYELSASEDIDGYIDGTPLIIEYFGQEDTKSDSNVPTVYVKEGRSDKSLEIMADELSEELGISVVDGQLYKRL